MMDGHFVWLWIDTAAVIKVRNSTDELAENNENAKNAEFEELRIKKNSDSKVAFQNVRGDAEQFRIRRRAVSRDLEDMNINYLLQNDQYLLFNSKNNGVESSKLKDRRSDKELQKKIDSDRSGVGISHQKDLPAGLLSLKPLPVKIDRHLVKGAVRLLSSVLKDVLDRSPAWMIQNLVAVQNNGCWRNVVIKESTFISNFGK